MLGYVTPEQYLAFVDGLPDTATPSTRGVMFNYSVTEHKVDDIIVARVVSRANVVESYEIEGEETCG